MSSVFLVICYWNTFCSEFVFWGKPVVSIRCITIIDIHFFYSFLYIHQLVVYVRQVFFHKLNFINIMSSLIHKITCGVKLGTCLSVDPEEPLWLCGDDLTDSSKVLTGTQTQIFSMRMLGSPKN